MDADFRQHDGFPDFVAALRLSTTTLRRRATPAGFRCLCLWTIAVRPRYATPR